jgi:hypothetical protein
VIEKKLFIHNNPTLYNILYELEEFMKCKIYYTEDESLKLNFQDINNYLLISNKIVKDINNQFQFDGYPISILRLLEKINICFLKQNFKNQSKIEIGKFFIDINSRKLILGTDYMSMTEKETNLILFLFKNNNNCSVEVLEKNVWGFKKNLETHTVETHIYRLRKKILSKFGVKDFIVFDQNGYLINP